MKGKGRQANFELLRIVAMYMVVVLHYLVKGGAEISLVEDTGAVNLLVWLVKGLCIVTVNLYVLLSGYFLLEARWKFSRVAELWLQMMFYSVGVPLVCLVLGIGEVPNWGLYDWINVMFPVQMEHYWFVTAYMVLYLFIPVLSAGVKHITKKQHQLVIAGLLLFFSIPKTILPVLIPTDRYGYDFGWFMCLFMIAAYIRLYGISFFNSKKRAVGIYLMVIAVIWSGSLACGILSRKGLPLAYMMDMFYCYNHILVLAASVALFYAFKYMQISNKRIACIICKVSPYVFGVYLLHENLAVRNLWQFWLGIASVQGKMSLFLHMVIAVTLVFVTGVMVDFVRSCIFKFVIRIWKQILGKKQQK